MSGKVVTQDGKSLASQVWRPESAIERMKGLLAWSRLEPGQGMWIEPCSSVHTFFMKFELDLIFLDNQSRVKKTVNTVHPWRISCCFGARITLELPAGTLTQAGIENGQSLYWREN